MMSTRPREDKGWDWLRPSDYVKKFLRFEERFPGVFELVCLDGWPSKVMTNRPDGSYATKDLFVKHPTMEAYKYYARLDDTIILYNGEKVNPLDLEGRVRQRSTVAEAIAFGAGKAQIGLAVVRAPGTESLSDEEVIDSIWPAVEKAHEALPAFGQLSKNMVRVLPADTPYPRTDKGTIIRQAFYKNFQPLVEEVYAAVDAMTGTLVLSEPELRDFLKKQILQILPLKDTSLLTDDADFFSLGMDSLQASQLRTVLVQNLDTKGQQLGLNIAFEQPTIAVLARFLAAVQSGEALPDSQPIPEQMRALISQFSHFEPHVPRSNDLPGRYVVSHLYHLFKYTLLTITGPHRRHRLPRQPRCTSTRAEPLCEKSLLPYPRLLSHRSLQASARRSPRPPPLHPSLIFLQSQAHRPPRPSPIPLNSLPPGRNLQHPPHRNHRHNPLRLARQLQPPAQQSRTRHSPHPAQPLHSSPKSSPPRTRHLQLLLLRQQRRQQHRLPYPGIPPGLPHRRAIHGLCAVQAHRRTHLRQRHALPGCPCPPYRTNHRRHQARGVECHGGDSADAEGCSYGGGVAQVG